MLVYLLIGHVFYLSHILRFFPECQEWFTERTFCSHNFLRFLFCIWLFKHHLGILFKMHFFFLGLGNDRLSCSKKVPLDNSEVCTFCFTSNLQSREVKQFILYFTLSFCTDQVQNNGIHSLTSLFFHPTYFEQRQLLIFSTEHQGDGKNALFFFFFSPPLCPDPQVST